MTQRIKEEVIETEAITPKFVFAWVDTQYGREYLPAVEMMVNREDEGGKITLTGKPLLAFYRLIGLKKTDIMACAYQYMDHTTRYGNVVKKRLHTTAPKADELVQEAWHGADNSVKAWKFLFVDGQVERLTSHYYEGIPHGLIQKTIRDRLAAEGIDYDEKIRRNGTEGVYTFATGATREVGNTISNAVVYSNQNDGLHSMNIYGGGEVLVCSNGMISMRTKTDMRMPHMHDEKEVVRRIEIELGRILEGIDILPRQFLALKKYTVSEEKAKIMIGELPVPMYIQLEIAKKLFGYETYAHNKDWDGTMWGLYMASTWVATHMEKIKDRNMVREIRPEATLSLKAIETFSEMWDRREKIEANEGNAQVVKKIQSLGAESS